MKPAVLLLAITLVLSAGVVSSSETTTVGRDREIVRLKQRQVELRALQEDLERKQELSRQGLLSLTELRRAQTALEVSRLELQDAVLVLLRTGPHVQVLSALKQQALDGRKKVVVTLVNINAPLPEALLADLPRGSSDGTLELLRDRSVHDLFVSLRETGEAASSVPAAATKVEGAILAVPYEHHVPILGPGQSQALSFELLKDVPVVIVSMSYGGQTSDVPLLLQQALIGGEIAVTSTETRQEVELGSQATFDIRLERARVEERGYELRVLGLPGQMSSQYLDPHTGARLARVNMPSGVTQLQLQLRLFLPDRPDAQVMLDRPLGFWAVAIAQNSRERFAEDRTYSRQEIERSGAGRLYLEVIPRGTGRLDVTAASLFLELDAGDTIASQFSVRNAGTRRLSNVRVTATPPSRWNLEVTPDLIADLDVGREATIGLKIAPPRDVAVGDYEVRVKPSSFADNRLVASEEKAYRVHVRPRARLLSTVLASSALVLLVGGVVFMVFRFARR